MRTLPDLLDRALRTLLRLPGVVVERLDGERIVQDDVGPADVFPVVRRTARHPEAWLALEQGLHYTRHDDLVLGWQHRGRTAFAVGGLNAPPAQRVPLLRAFARQAASRGIVRQLVFPLRDEELEDAGRAGFAPIQVGVEARLHLPSFSTRGNRFENLRQMRNRARRRGVGVEEVAAEAHRDELEQIHEAWLRAKRPSWRMKLLVGSPALEAPFGRRYFVARTAGRVEAFVTVLPTASPATWGLDVMCRRPDAVAGSMERLLLHVIDALRTEGAEELSLGACPMAGVPVSRERPVLTRLFRWLYASSLGNRIFGFRSLVAFKEKFHPRWQPVYFGAHPGLGWWSLYQGCRMWGLY